MKPSVWFQVTKVKWYMLHYGSPCPKPHYCYSNSGAIKNLNMGKLKGWRDHLKTLEKDGKARHKTMEVYKDKAGKTRYKGYFQPPRNRDP